MILTRYSHTARGTVLVALDGSPAAATALPTAFAVAEQLGAECQALHIVRAGGLAADLSQPPLRLWEAVAGAPTATVKEFWRTEVRLDVGDAAVGIIRASADPTVALVVLTTHGQVIEPGRSMGRVAERVIASVTQPVLLIRPEATGNGSTHGVAVKRVLLPLDGTPTTAMLLQPACELASQLGAVVDLLYVVADGQVWSDEPGSIGAPRYVDQPQHEWRAWADEVIERLGVACAGCAATVIRHVFLARGDIGREVARFAREQVSDVVVLARRSQLEPGRARVLRAVLDHTPCPVLLIGAPTVG